MPSKRCVTLAKRSEKCSSAPATNRMACQSRCEIQVQASHRRILSTCSRLSTPRNRAVWGLGCRSAGRSSTRTAADCGRARTCPAAPAFNSPCRRSQTLRRDAALVSRPKEQATRPRVLLWVQNRKSLSFNHDVGEHNDSWRHFQVHCPRRLKVNHEVKFGWLHNRKVG